MTEIYIGMGAETPVYAAQVGRYSGCVCRPYVQIPHTPIRPALQADEKMSGLMSNQSVAAFFDRSKMTSPAPETSPRRSTGSFTAAANQVCLAALIASAWHKRTLTY